MEPAQDMTLHFLRFDGKREITKLSHHTVAQAHSLVEGLLRVTKDVYTEVEIHCDGRYVETVQSPHVALEEAER
jgi:hypothetical protein